MFFSSISLRGKYIERRTRIEEIDIWCLILHLKGISSLTYVDTLVLQFYKSIASPA